MNYNLPTNTSRASWLECRMNCAHRSTQSSDLPELSNENAEYHLDVYALNQIETDLMPKNYVVAFEQFQLTPSIFNTEVSASKEKIEVSSNKGITTISNDNFELKLDLAKGKIVSLDYGNGNVFVESIRPNFWRPVTDNDFGAKSPEKLAVWKEATDNHTLAEVKVFNGSKEISKSKKVKGMVNIKTVYDLPSVNGKVAIEYQIQPSGEIIITNKLSGINNDLPHLPRFGDNFIIKNEYQNVAWFGRGPHENYNDRNTAALVGNYQAKVEDLYFPYIRPQENGYKTDVRCVTFTNENGKGIKIEGLQLLGFSVHHQYNSDFDAGKEKQQRHTTDIVKRDLVNINIDYKQTGIGGDNSWSHKALAHEEFRVKPQDMVYSYKIKPVKN